MFAKTTKLKYEEFLSEQLLSRLHSDVVDFKKITKT